MTQYLLTVHGSTDDVAPSPEAMEAMYQDVSVFNEKLKAEGAWVFAGGLEPAATARVVRNTKGALLTTDGPFLEGKEHIGGFWVVEAPDFDSALRLAEQGSIACQGDVEVRPFQDEGES
jgi:hypothetical protein